MKHREMLGVGTRNTAHRGQFAHPVGGAHGSDAAHPGIPIRGVGGIELVTTGNPIQRCVFDDRVIDRKCVVPGDSEDIIDANFLEPSQDILMTVSAMTSLPFGVAGSNAGVHCDLEDGGGDGAEGAAAAWQTLQASQRGARLMPAALGSTVNQLHRIRTAASLQTNGAGNPSCENAK
jgi:hypothetical protein